MRKTERHCPKVLMRVLDLQLETSVTETRAVETSRQFPKFSDYTYMRAYASRQTASLQNISED